MANDTTKMPLLEATGITKRFPGVLALDDVQFMLRPGEVHSLVGENGAGKSTLMKVLGGIHKPDAGSLKLYGRETNIDGPLDAQSKGISIIHQELNLMPDLTVAQNIFFGREQHKGIRFNLSPRKMRQETDALLQRVGLQLDPEARVGDLTVATQQMVEIAKALSFDAKILIMDEPTAALTERETEALFKVMEDFVKPDTAIVYISHRMNEIKRVSDTITVMRDGQWVSTDPAADLSIDDIIEKMVGRRIESNIRPKAGDSNADVVLKVEGLSTKKLLKDVSFELRRGEILGFAGLVGAGRTETARALIGADPKTAGRVEIEGREVNIKSPEDAVKHSVAYLSEDRKRYGLLLDKDLVLNTALPSYRIWSRGIIVDDSKAEGTAANYISRLRVKTPSAHQRAKNLSGGNQQKVVIGKWLARDCDILIFDEPTRGIDVGAKDEIYDLLNQLAAQGKSIIVISSEIPEVLRLAQRIVVMWEGRVTGTINNDEATQNSIMALATGQTPTKTKESA
ncbi:Ribose import ATP-binding protein RbsA [Actinomyces bovis]|uniref:Ribose import ATP-binding protein RbsA n=1 Tax=Actinomyces bovis TaxID=1658 RepID=A0ABY1VMY3_9ACTO|nr:sugar ABC transporter ATP-binding protein [Actinomyces bovis]SPT52827.1 Ribose import ATP-binding protein RbsA [Actinomyces bovis]VEG54893.1 Ribose import ATP-binding protein RbsA [Actinomyces israelii]